MALRKVAECALPSVRPREEAMLPFDSSSWPPPPWDLPPPEVTEGVEYERNNSYSFTSHYSSNGPQAAIQFHTNSKSTLIQIHTDSKSTPCTETPPTNTAKYTPGSVGWGHTKAGQGFEPPAGAP